MAGINTEIVREYFELKGFFVRVLKKSVLTGSERDDISTIDMACWNSSHPEKSDSKLPFVLNSTDALKISKAIVIIRGWHTEIFSPSVVAAFFQGFQFSELDSSRVSRELFNEKDFSRILVIPLLPQNPELRNRSIDLLKEKNVTHVLEFKTVLSELIDEAQINRNYQESEILQMLRILKRYDCLKGKQLELFTR